MPADRSPSPNTRLLDAVWNGDPELVAWALAHGASPNARVRTLYAKGQTALHRALSNTDMALDVQLGLVAQLLEAGANPNLVDANGQTPADLLFATYTPHHAMNELLPVLLKHGMSLAGGSGSSSAVDAPVFQCLRWLSPHNRLDEVLAHGGALTQRNKQGDTPLLALVRSVSRTSSMDDRLELLLQHKADVNAISALDGGSPLTVLTTTLADDPGSSEVSNAVQRLLAAGANPNHGQKLLTTSRFGGRASHASPDPAKLERPLATGYTALHLAAWYGTTSVCEALLAHGASPVLRTQGQGLPCTVSRLERMDVERNGFTPHELARINGHDALAIRLEGAELAVEMHTTPMNEASVRPRGRL